MVSKNQEDVIKTNDTAKIITAISDLGTGLRAEFQELRTELHGDQTQLRTEFHELRTEFQGLRVGVHNLELQVYGARADIVKMKEEILGAFDGITFVPEMSLKVEQHQSRIELLEHKSAVVEAVIKDLNRK